VLLPGRASASPVGAANLRSLLRIRGVYTVDLLGEPGRSVQTRPIASPADRAAWLREALDGLPEERVHLLGVSIGGWTAVNEVAHGAGKVASLSLIDPVFVFANMSATAIIRSVPASVRWLPRNWRDGFNRWTANGAKVKDVPVADMIEAGMQTYALKLGAPRRISEEQLGRLGVPVLALIAGRSPMHDPVEAAAVAERALPPGSRVKVYPRASHALNGEYPDEVAADVAKFIAAG
jgi:pimeloyl-ACP methyl ester carboxylesterase